MKYTPTTDKFHDTIHLVDQTTPVQGGTPVFDAQGNPIKGASNASRVQLADNIAYLKKGLETATTVVDGESTSTLDTYVKETRSDVDALEAAASDTDARINNLEIATVRVQGYTALRAYAGAAVIVDVTSAGIAGRFAYDPFDTATADNGGTVIVSSNGCRWKRADNRHDVKMFGAKGDHNGTTGTDDTEAINRYLEWCASSGLTAFFPSGLYQYSGELTLDLSIYPKFYEGGRKLSIKGESLSNTGIVYVGAAPVMWSFSGTYPAADYFDISGMYFIRRGAASENTTVLSLKKLLAPSFNKLSFVGFGKALAGDTLTGVSWKEVHITFCKSAASFTNYLGSPCNLMKFDTCTFSGNNGAGVMLNIGGAVNVKFVNTGFEGNKATVSTVGVVNSGANGVSAVDFDGCYFEGNSGLADIYITHGSQCIYNFRATSFNRISNTDFTISNIIFDPESLGAGGAKCVVNMEAGFMSSGNYAPSVDRPSVMYGKGATNSFYGYTIDDEGSAWTHAEDKPQYPAKVKLLNDRSRVKAAVRCTADGSIVSSYGVTGVTKTGTGVYVVTLAHGLDVTAIPQVTLFGAGFGFVNSDSGNTITVETRNTAATATNLPFSLSVI